MAIQIPLCYVTVLLGDTSGVFYMWGCPCGTVDDGIINKNMNLHSHKSAFLLPPFGSNYQGLVLVKALGLCNFKRCGWKRKGIREKK